MSTSERPPHAPTAGRSDRIAVSAPVVRAAEDSPEAEPARILFPVKVVGGGALAAGGPDGGGERRRKVAVLVSHWMGQQVPYENIDLIARALAKADGQPAAAAPKPRVRFAKLGKEWFPRAELTLEAGERPTEVHVYEAYWAPLTEGKVSALDVTRFLLSAGVRGTRYALRGSFDRWIFGGRKTFSLGWFSLPLLLGAFATVASALVLYAALGALVLLKLLGLFVAPAAVDPLAARLSAGLGVGLLRSPLLLSLLLAPAVGLVWTGRVLAHLAPAAPPAAREKRAIVFAAAVALVTLSGLAALERWPFGTALLDVVLPEAAGVFAPEWAWFAVAGAALLAVLALSVPLALLCRKSSTRPWVSGLSLAAALLLAAWVVASAGAIAWRAAAGVAARDPSLELGRPLFVLFLASAAYLCYRVRGVYIQYLGDVAVYVSSHQLNEFAELRAKIREKGFETGCAVYGARREGGGWEYDEVVMAGHSLGAVVAYDTLNALLNEDFVVGGALEAERRTRALVTFGSPLDKTAFLFRTQVEDASYREALAAAVQPLIEPLAEDRDGPSRGRTIPWRNVYSPFDPVSGTLEYYDPQPKEGHEVPAGHLPVENRPDRDAAIFGVAHVVYWHNPELVDHLYEVATTPRPIAAGR